MTHNHLSTEDVDAIIDKGLEAINSEVIARFGKTLKQGKLTKLATQIENALLQSNLTA